MIPRSPARRHQHPDTGHDVRGEDQVHRGQPEGGADQGFERAVRRRPVPVDLVDQVVAQQRRLGGRVEFREHLHQLVEQRVECCDRRDVLLEQQIQNSGGFIETDRRVDQEHAVELERPPLLVQPGNEGRVGGAEAVADEVVGGDRDLVLDLVPDQLHHLVHIPGVAGQEAWPARRRSAHDEVRMQRRGQRDDV